MSKSKPFHSLCAVLLALCLGLGSVTAMAQSQASTGQITGTVTDPQGSGISAANITATNIETGLSRSAKSKDDGVYSIALLPPGKYKVSAEASGFASTTIENVEVTVGRTIDINVSLGVSGVQEIVSVTAGAIQVQTTRSEADSVLNQQAINDLPINGRRFQDFVTLTPTAQVDTQRGQISLVGQRGIYGANINIDGVDYNQPFFGGIRGGERSNNAFTVPQEAIKEFQVVAAGYTAEFGRSTGGIVNAVTKSGTNEYHGSGFYLHRPKDLAKKNLFYDALELSVNQSRVSRNLTPIDVVPAPTQQQWGGSFGGPIKKNKAFFFGAFEQQRFRNNRNVFFDVFSAAAFTPTPASQEAFDHYQSLQVPFTSTNDAIALLGRFDYELSQNHRFNVRYSHSNNEAKNSNSVGNQLFPTTISALSNNGTEKDNTDIFVGQMTSTLGTSLVNEFRGQYAREERPRPANAVEPNVTNGIGRFGTVNFLGQNVQNDWRVQLADSMIWTRGSHTFKFGGEYNHVFVAQTFGFNQTGVFNISGAATSQAGITTILDIMGVGGTIANRFDSSAVTFLKQIGNLAAEFSTNEIAFFGQDAWRLRPNFTLNLGLRWEGQYNPSPQANNDILINLVKGFRFPSGHIADPTIIPDDTKQWGPRLGFAWDPWGDSKTVVRGYGGVYNARTPQLIFAGPFNNFRTPPGDLSIQLPLSTATLPTGNPLKTCTTVWCQLNLIGVNLNNFPLNKLPIITAEQVQSIAGALGLSGFSPFTGAAPILMEPHFKNPRSYQGGIGIEREVARGLTVGADFAVVNTIHLQRNREVNIPRPFLRATDPAQRPFYGLRTTAGTGACLTTANGGTAPVGSCIRPIPSLGSIQLRESSARSLYRSLTLRAKFQRKWGQFNAFYTLSKSLSDDDNERDAGGVGYDDNYNFVPEYGPARLDRRHQFLFSPLIYLPMGFEISSGVRLLSGRPIDATLGSDNAPAGNEDLVSNDRPYSAPGVPFQRNAFRNRAIYNIDMRGQKRFRITESQRLTISVEVFNLLNLENIELAGTAVTNFCASATATCGFLGPTNPNFLSLRDNNPASTRFGSLLLGNNPNAFGGVFQLQFGARYQF